jgi:hypothetical protein
MSKPLKQILSALRGLEAEDLNLPDDEKYLENALIVADDIRRGVSHKTTFDPILIAILLIQLQEQEKETSIEHLATEISGYA